MSAKQFYIYLYVDPITDKELYVGKGQGRRAWDHFIPSSRSRLSNTLRKRIKQGYNPQPIIINMIDESTAIAMEMFWISYYGREDLGTGTLFNLTSGGEGFSGLVRTKEHRDKLSKLNIGKKLSEETKQKMRGRIPPNKGRPMCDEQKAKLSIARKKHSGPNKGKIMNDETKFKLSEANKGKKLSEETRNKISKSSKERQSSEEYKKACSERVKSWWAERKQNNTYSGINV